jgi:plasmid maintenance system antidote protein VapI
LSKYFGTTAKFWLGLQDDYDIEKERNAIKKQLDTIQPFNNNAA